MKFRLLCIMFSIMFSSLYAQEYHTIENPFNSTSDRWGFDIIEFLYPDAFEIPKVIDDETIMFFVSVNHLDFNNVIVDQLIGYHFRNLELNRAYSFSQLVENTDWDTEYFCFDFDEDGRKEILNQVVSPNGGGEEYVICWKETEAQYKISEVFWGKIGRITRESEEYRLIVPGLFDGPNPFPSIFEIKINKFDIIKDIDYCSALSIPLTSIPLCYIQAKTKSDRNFLRAWPKEVNVGIFYEMIQMIDNGNIIAEYKGTNSCLVVGKYFSKSKYWYLILVPSSIKMTYHIMGEDYNPGEYQIGWIDEESLLFAE